MDFNCQVGIELDMENVKPRRERKKREREGEMCDECLHRDFYKRKKVVVAAGGRGGGGGGGNLGRMNLDNLKVWSFAVFEFDFDYNHCLIPPAQ